MKRVIYKFNLPKVMVLVCAVTVFLLANAAVALAIVPQNLGITDKLYADWTAQDCRVCHGENTANLHAAIPGYQCTYCHTIDANGMLTTQNDCKVCHATSTTHHNTATMPNGTCNSCHSSSLIDNMNTVSIPTRPFNKTTPLQSSCNNCHSSPANRDLHHQVGSDCGWCHNAIDPSNIRSCEKCHSENTLHNISGHSQPESCLGCHSVIPETVPPVVANIDPTDGAQEVPVDKNIVVKFSENVNPGANFGGISVKAGDTIVSSTCTLNGDTLTIDPNENLKQNTVYSVLIPAGVVYDDSGNLFAADYTFNFTCQSLPALVSEDPIDGANVVPVDKTITVKFSETIIPGADFSKITLTTGTTVIDYTYQIDLDTLILTPVNGLESNKTYTLNIPVNAIADKVNNILQQPVTVTFTTIDTIAPYIVNSDPVNGAKEVPVDKIINIKFNEEIVAGEAYGNIALMNGATVIPAVVTINNDTLTITPMAPLENNTNYTVNIPTGAVKDLAGNAFVNSGQLGFSSPDTIAPAISGSDPLIGAIKVSVDKTLVITFSENILEGVNFNQISLKKGKNIVSVTGTISGNTLIIDPNTNLNYNSKYVLYIPAGAVQDAAGNSLTTPFELNFATQRK